MKKSNSDTKKYTVDLSKPIVGQVRLHDLGDVTLVARVRTVRLQECYRNCFLRCRSELHSSGCRPSNFRIFLQVGYLGADYDEWVHDPIVSRESPRFFESDISEVRNARFASVVLLAVF